MTSKIECIQECRINSGSLLSCLRKCLKSGGNGDGPSPSPSLTSVIYRATGCREVHVPDRHMDLPTDADMKRWLVADQTDKKEYETENWNCLLPDTALIAKYNGNISVLEIEDLYRIQWFHKDIYVLDHNQEWTRVNWIRPKQSNNDTIIRSQHGHLKLTEDHKVKCRGEYHKLGDLSEKDNVDQIKLWGTFKNDIEIDNELAWALGLFHADGYANHYIPTKTQSHKYNFEIANTNRDFLERALNALSEEYGDIFEIQTFESDKPGNVRGGVTLKYQQYHLRIASQGRETGRKSFGNKEFVCKMMPYLYSAGHNKIVPSFIINATKEAKKAYLEGVWAGDGEKNTTNTRITLSSEIGSLGIQILLEETTKKYTTMIHRGKNAWDIVYGYSQSQKQNNMVERIPHSGIVYDINTEAGELSIGNFCCKNCDDFARTCWNNIRNMALKEGKNIAFALTWSQGHALNLYVNNNRQVVFIEPQTDKRTSVHSALRFVIF